MGNIFSVQISSGDAIFSRCLDCTGKRARHIHDLEDNLQALETELQKLVEARNDLMRRVNFAERKQMKRTDQVQGWLSRIQAVEAEVGELLKVKPQELEKLCLGGYCSKNCMSSYKFGKKVAKTLQVVATLKGEGDFEVTAEKVEEDTADEIPLDPTVVGLESTFDKAWRFIGEEGVRIIGIYGKGGVGKTTLLKKINNNFCSESHAFDVVIWAMASKEPNLEKIQEEIGKKVGLLNESWKNKSLQDKARLLFSSLNKKRFVLLLDDIWKWIDLTEVGVPFPSSKSKSKIIFTTRFLDVCGAMKADQKLEVYCLGNDEAWELFQQHLQRDVLCSHPDIPELARTVVKECGGLPLAIITVGRAMSCKKTPEEWRYAIYVLSSLSYKFPRMEIDVYRLLKFSYDSLPNDTIRSCLLYCSLFPEDYKIPKRHLIDCWIGEEFLDLYDENEVYNQGYDYIGVLVRACLLEEEDEGEEHIVKMHDVIRDMALWITCETENIKEIFFVKAGGRLIKAPEAERWKRVSKMSLMQNRIENLLVTPISPNLRILFLNDNKLEMIKDDFFQFMPSLKVLNLSKNFFPKKLLFGISNLVSLQYLNLSCVATLEELPIDLKALVNLKCLDLEYLLRLRAIPYQLISNFSKLIVLRMFGCGGGFHVPAKDNILFGSGELLLEELVGLKFLNVLTISLRTSHALQRLLSSITLRNFTRSLYLESFEDSKWLNVSVLVHLQQLHRLDFRNCDELEEFKIENVQKTLPTYCFYSLQSVEINCCSKLRDLTWLVFASNLKFLSVYTSQEMEEIISARKLGVVEGMMVNLTYHFSKLKSLVLVDVPNLRSIHPKALPFPHLKKIFVSLCPKLKKLPLDSNSAKEHKIVIEGDEDWWKKLQWEDEATLNAFLPCFQSIWSMIVEDKTDFV